MLQHNTSDKCGVQNSECGVETGCGIPHGCLWFLKRTADHWGTPWGNPQPRFALRLPHFLIIRSRRAGLHAAEEHVGADEEGVPIVAELAVGGPLASVETAENLAVGRDAIDATRTRRPEV